LFISLSGIPPFPFFFLKIRVLSLIFLWNTFMGLFVLFQAIVSRYVYLFYRIPNMLFES
jgi:NADH:ubiquinone oxidoreductase subunit 2 (subunit N)